MEGKDTTYGTNKCKPSSIMQRKGSRIEEANLSRTVPENAQSRAPLPAPRKAQRGQNRQLVVAPGRDAVYIKEIGAIIRIEEREIAL